MSKLMQQILDGFDDFVEKYNDKEIEEEDAKKALGELQDMITCKEDLEDILPELKKKADDIENHLKECDENIKTYQSSKKMWNRRIGFFNKMLEKFLEKVKLTTLKKDNIKLSVSSRTTLIVDEEWLLGQYTSQVESLQQTLPPYLKVGLSIDKRELGKFLEKDNTLMLDNPEKLHHESKKSTNFK